MSDLLCLDSSYLSGLLDTRDSWHGDAASIQAVLEEEGVPTATPDCVVNEVLSVFARRCREHSATETFPALVQRVTEAIPETAITWLYPHVPHWFGRCVAALQRSAGVLTFHDALMYVAATELGFRAVVSFDACFDRLEGLARLGSADAVRSWLAERRRARQ